jgi:Vacuolar protein sorting-associated protein 62
MEITDTGKSRLSHGKKLDVVVDTLFPRPVRYREVWKQEGGDKPLYVWRPVPPSSAFVVLGMIATTTEEQPPLDAVRCLPRRWTKPAEVRERRQWRQRRPSLCINSLNRIIDPMIELLLAPGQVGRRTNLPR